MNRRKRGMTLMVAMTLTGVALPLSAQDTGSDPNEVLRLGMEQGTFNLTVLAIRLSSTVNGVSALHGQVSRKMWHNLWPRVPAEEVPIRHVTNGIHADSWTDRSDSGTPRPGARAGWRQSGANTGQSVTSTRPCQAAAALARTSRVARRASSGRRTAASARLRARMPLNSPPSPPSSNRGSRRLARPSVR